MQTHDLEIHETSLHSIYTITGIAVNLTGTF